MNNWRTTIGGAVGTLGTALVGGGLLTQFTEVPDEAKHLLWYTAFVGFILVGVGKFLTSLFSADAKTVSDVVKQTNVNTVNIADAKQKLEDTQTFKKG